LQAKITPIFVEQIPLQMSTAVVSYSLILAYDMAREHEIKHYFLKQDEHC